MCPGNQGLMKNIFLLRKMLTNLIKILKSSQCRKIAFKDSPQYIPRPEYLL